MEVNEVRNLKRYLKNKIKVTEALIVMFLITGGIAYSAEPAVVTEPTKNTVEKIISNEIVEKFKNPKNEKEYFEYKLSFKDGANKEKVLRELKVHVIEKQPKYLNKADAREESILTQEMQGYEGINVENYLSKNNAELVAFEKANNTNKILAGGAGLFGAVAAAIAIFDHDSGSDGGNNSANPPVDPPIDPIDPPVDPPTTPSKVVIINGEKVIVDGGTVTVNNLNITASKGVVAAGEGANVNMTGDTTISSEQATIAAMAINGGTITNTGNITLSQSGDIVMLAQNTTPSIATFSTSLYASPIQTTVINEGNIGGIVNIAMKADGLGATAKNDMAGTITTSSLGTDPSYGIYSINSGAALNDGKISNSSINGNSYGIYADGVGSTAVNRLTGVISNTSDTGSSYGMYANAGGTATNEGIIANKSNSGYSVGMYANGLGSISINKGEISNSSNSGYSYGMYSNGGTVINEGTISTTSESGESQGIFSVGGTVVNSGEILNSSFGSSYSYGITTTEGGTATNDGIISNTSEAAYSVGMNAHARGTVINNGKIDNSSSSANSYGMVANGAGSTATNTSAGIISNSSDTGYSYGMYADAGGTATNEGEISNSSVNGRSYGMYANGNGSTVINEATGTISNSSDFSNSYGMYANGSGSTAKNYGTISNKIYSTEDNLSSVGMFASTGGAVQNYGTISNHSDVVMENQASTSIGMRINGGGTAINNEGATIANSSLGTSTGIQNDGNSGVALNYGTISNTGVERSTGIAGAAINYGTISNSSELYASHGMEIGGSGATSINEVSGVISNTSTSGVVFGMYGESGASIVNKGKITSEALSDTYGMDAKGTGTTATNTSTGVISNSSDTGYSYGMYADAGGTATNEGSISNSSVNGRSYGMYANGNGSTVINEATGTISNHSDSAHSYGMYANGNGATALNYGTISNTISSTAANSASTGMFAMTGGTVQNYGTISNESDLVIENTTTSIGMRINGGGTAINNEGATIANSSLGTSTGIQNDGNSGIVLNYGTISNTGVERSNGIAGAAINYGTISNSSELYASHGMEIGGSGATSINEVGGVISNTSTSGAVFGMYGESGASIVNKGKITSEALNDTYGMDAKGTGSAAINTSTGIISNSSDTGKSYGMYSDAGGTAKNEGEISNSSTKGRSYGMYASGGGASIVNAKTGVISNTSDADNSYGMYTLNGGTAINYGTISNKSKSGASNGMFSESGGVIINEGKISNSSDLAEANTTTSQGMYVWKGGTAINRTDATISNSSLGSSTGILVAENNGTALNYGTISNTGVERSTGISGTATNYGTISNSSELYTTNGMDISGNGATSVNEVGGVINNTSTLGDSRGMFANEGALIVNKGEVSNESLGNSVGMEVLGTGTVARNYGAISNISTGADSYGMKASIEALAVNEVGGIIGNVSTTGNSYGMYADSEGTATNGGIISNTSTTGISYGMYATDSGSTAINTSTGVINVNTVNSYGMYGTNGATITNEGTINLNADSGTGMYADNGATLNNEGTINLNSTNGTAIHATGEGTTVKNSGEIYISGDEVSGEASELLSVDENGNQAVKIEDGATFVNNGLLMVEGELDTTEITEDGGQVVVEGGTIEAETIRGDFYASGALAMGGYEDTYDTYQMFKTDNMYANIYSNSAMFDVELTAQDDLGYYGIEMTRKNFNEVIANSGYAQYLENNYTAENNSEAKENLYDAYKLVVSESDLNNAVDSTFGNTIYPTLMHQTLTAIRDINRDIKSNVFSSNNFSEVNGVRFIGFGSYRDSEVSFDDSRLTEYDREMSSVTLGADKRISDTVNLGALFTVAKADYDFDNGDSREDDMYQLNLVASYEKDNVLGTATAYLGKSTGDLDRTLSVTSIHEEMEGDVDNNYYGLDLSLEKRYELSRVNVTPRVELNMMHVEQESVDEKGTYALDVDTTESTSVESGLGVQLDKTYEVGNGYKITPIASAMYYREFADPYEDSTATLSSVSSDKITIEEYDAEKDRGEFALAVVVEKKDFGVKVGVDHSVDSEGSETTPFIGIGYKF